MYVRKFIQIYGTLILAMIILCGCSTQLVLLDSDSDGDGFSDEDELTNVPATDPLDPNDNPFRVLDSDGDGCSDFEEVQFIGLCDNDPNSSIDSDRDGILDNEEAILGTDPFVADTDGDGLADGDEIVFGSNPLVSDSDHDGLNDFDEWVFGTNPNFSDSDFDLIPDGEEVHVHNTDPLKKDTDGDTLTDWVELQNPFHTDPTNPDTDGDGFLDGEEIDLALQPLEFNPSGNIVDVYCDDYVLAQSGSVIGIFKVSQIFGGFSSGFRPGDPIAFLAEGIPGTPIGPIRANLRTLETGFAFWQGQRSQTEQGTITDAVETFQSIRIFLSSGRSFEVSVFDIDESLDWRIGDDIQFINTGFGTKALNVDLCEVVLVSF